MSQRTRRQLIQSFGLFGAGLYAGLPLWAQANWPNKTVTYVVPFSPGGTTDVLGRTICGKLSERLGQSFIVDNRPGAGGAVGASFVSKSAPDGYTLLGGTISTHAINASLYKNLPYDPVKDFEPVSLLGFLPNVLIVGANQKINNISELVLLLKNDPSKRTFASSGSGTSAHLAGIFFGESIDVPLTHIPYKGTPPAMTDVAGGQVTFMFDQITAALPLVQAGKLKILAIASPKRSGVIPQVPTMIESGIPKFEAASWQAVFAPKGTPKVVVNKLNSEIAAILKMPDVRQKFENQLGMTIAGGPPDELAKLMAREIPRWADLVRKSGATAE